LRVASVVVAAITAVACSSAIAAEAFRIQTKIFTGEEEEPVSKTTTMFQNGVVYDFLENPEQIAVFRKANGDRPGRFILLNDINRVQTEITADRLSSAMQKLTQWAGQQKDPFLQFAAEPKFDETFDRNTGKLVLASKLETYTVDTTPVALHQDALVDYREFLDGYTQLNALLTAGNPPNPRLKLNDALARRKVIPTKVELKRGGEDPIRAEHEFTWRLSQDDLQRIEEVQEGLTAYREVENQEFQQLAQPVAAAKK
jgi:hypothetical protein